MVSMQGVYKITNLINKKIYIGISTDLKSRINSHKSLLRRCKHKNKHLQSSWNKYGELNFKFELLLYADNIETKLLNLLEEQFIDYYKCLTNGFDQINGGGYMKYNEKSEQTKIRIKEASVENIKIAQQLNQRKVEAEKDGIKFLFNSIKEMCETLSLDYSRSIKILKRQYISKKGKVTTKVKGYTLNYNHNN